MMMKLTPAQRASHVTSTRSAGQNKASTAQVIIFEPAAARLRSHTYAPVVSVEPVKPPRTYCALDRMPAALIPLTKHRRWVTWRWEWLKDKGKWTKEPYQAAAPQYHAKSNASDTWGTYATALAAYRANAVHGIGYMMFKGGVAALDLDDCRDPASEQLTPWAQDFVAKAAALGAYVEVTVSGTGLRIIGTIEGDKVQRKYNFADGTAIEVFRKCERYITVSCLQIGECIALPNIDALIDQTVTECDERKKREKAEKPDRVIAGDDREKLSAEEYQELLERGTIGGKMPEHRGPEFQALVWHLACNGKNLDEIIALLRQNTNGLAAKFLQPADASPRRPSAATRSGSRECPMLSRTGIRTMLTCWPAVSPASCKSTGRARATSNSSCSPRRHSTSGTASTRSCSARTRTALTSWCPLQSTG
jgi:hypothetical protein